jgi:tetrahydromethanopterin S-methyltransferase subunit G
MPRTLLRWGTPVIVAILAMVVRGPVFAQGPTGNADVLASLLAEVRGLRAAIENLASAGPRVQLAIGRLQLQEQRVNTALRRLDDLHGRRMEVERELAQLRSELARGQEIVERTSDPTERQGVEMQAKMLKDGIARGSRDVQRLTVEEADAAAVVTAEQGRWNEINQRLEELERALARR